MIDYLEAVEELEGAKHCCDHSEAGEGVAEEEMTLLLPPKEFCSCFSFTTKVRKL